jgi:hypothetical protein
VFLETQEFIDQQVDLEYIKEPPHHPTSINQLLVDIKEYLIYRDKFLQHIKPVHQEFTNQDQVLTKVELHLELIKVEHQDCIKEAVQEHIKVVHIKDTSQLQAQLEQLAEEVELEIKVDILINQELIVRALVMSKPQEVKAVNLVLHTVTKRNEDCDNEQIIYLNLCLSRF